MLCPYNHILANIGDSTMPEKTKIAVLEEFDKPLSIREVDIPDL